jgi:hypothetical protein
MSREPGAKFDRELERLLLRTLGDHPDRPAPITLEARVQGELARRAALPWWRRSFSHWPSSVRVVFTVICLGLGGVALLIGGWVVGLVNSVHAPTLPGARSLRTLLDAVGGLTAPLFHAIPATWVYDGIAASVALYAALFGLAVAAYQSLYLADHSGASAQ